MNLIHFREIPLIFFRIWGEAELILRIRGAKENTFRELRNFLSGIWEINALFLGIKGAQTPPPPPRGPQFCTALVQVLSADIPMKYTECSFNGIQREYSTIGDRLDSLIMLDCDYAIN